MLSMKQNEEEKNKKNIICVNNAFHGRTYAAISASGQSRMLEGFLPALNGFEQVEFNNIDAIKKKIDNKTAGILIETIQGEGGITPANKKYLKDLYFNDLQFYSLKLIFLSFIIVGLFTEANFASTYTYKSSSYIWTTFFLFLGL
mgnify:CR=1 FL=1